MQLRATGFFPKLAAAALAIAAFAPCAHAQQNAAMPMAGMYTFPAPDTLPPPIHMTGIGNSHITITATPDAQVWFDQGLTLMHDFWDYESARAFEQGIRVDPNCAMCYWGLAEIEGFRSSAGSFYAKQAIARAKQLEHGVTEPEKLYIDASRADKDKKRIAILRKLVKKNPSDPEARIFLAIAVKDGYDNSGEPKAGEKESISILESVLRDAPNDSAANHYWIHAMEPSKHPERAIPSAALLASLAPNSGHMVHMPGHIYYRVGDYAQAEHWFKASTAVDEAYMHAQHVSPDDDWNYVHNLMYSIADLMEQGKLAEADTLSDHLARARGQLSVTLYTWNARDQISRVSYRLPVVLRTSNWDVMLAMLNAQELPDRANTANLRFLSSQLHEFATGMRALDHNDVAAAQAASTRMDATLQAFQKSSAAAKHDTHAKKAGMPMVPIMPDAESQPLIHWLSIANLELQAGVAAAQGKLDAAKTLYATASRQENNLGYHEPPLYIRPVGETEGAALLKAKDYAGARLAYQAALVERPNSGFALYGIARADELAGDAAAARTGYLAVVKAFPHADADLPELAHARQFLAVNNVASR